jgi:hypothetical protein
LEAEIPGKPGQVASHRLVEDLGRNAVEPGQILVEHDPLATDGVDGALDAGDGNDGSRRFSITSSRNSPCFHLDSVALS